MKKLNNFQKFALSAEKSNSVRGGAVAPDDTLRIACTYGVSIIRKAYFKSWGTALAWCSKSTKHCHGCFQE